MPHLNRVDAVRPSAASHPHYDHASPDDEAFDFSALDAEFKRLAAANQELLGEFHGDDTALDGPALTDADELSLLRLENAELKARLQELEAMISGQAEELWHERQREYETLLEEKSEVIRDLHHRIQEIQESALGGPGPSACSTSASSTRIGQAEEILHLKREMDEQRRQLEADEEEMMAQMRQMELTMAKERAEMARQRQEVQRQQAELAREIENSNRDPDLRERLQTLRRSSDSRQTPLPGHLAAKPSADAEQKSSGFLRRIFG